MLQRRATLAAIIGLPWLIAGCGGGFDETLNYSCSGDDDCIGGFVCSGEGTCVPSATPTSPPDATEDLPELPDDVPDVPDVPDDVPDVPDDVPDVPDEVPDCIVDCTDKDCGPDGCGGSCGDCDDDDPCTTEQCGVDAMCESAPVESPACGCPLQVQALTPTPALTHAHFNVVKTHGDILHAVSSRGLWSFDVSDPAWPVPLGLVPGTFLGLDVVGETAYATYQSADGATQYVGAYDMSDPSAPTKLGETEITGWLYDVVAGPEWLYIQQSHTGLSAIELDKVTSGGPITTVDVPTLTSGPCDAGLDASLAGQIYITGVAFNPATGTVWATARLGGLLAVDVSALPAPPSCVSHSAPPGTCGNSPYAPCPYEKVAVDPGTQLAAVAHAGQVILYDISDPLAPVQLTAASVKPVGTGTWSSDVAFAPGRVYVTARSHVETMSVTSTKPPGGQPTGSFGQVTCQGVTGEGDRTHAQNGVVYVGARQGGVQIFGLSEDSELELKSRADTPPVSMGVSRLGEDILLAGGGAGVQHMLWKPDPTTCTKLPEPPPAKIPWMQTEAWIDGVSRDLVSVGAISFVATGSGGLQTVKRLSYRMDRVDGLDTPGDAVAVAVHFPGQASGDQGWAYVADGAQGLLCAKVTKAGLILEKADALASYCAPATGSGDPALGVTVDAQGKVWVARGSAGVRLTDLPSAPVAQEVELETGAPALDVAVADSWAAVATGPGGVALFDLDGEPGTVIETRGHAERVLADGDTLYVATGSGGVTVIDVAGGTPGAASKIADIETPGRALDVAIAPVNGKSVLHVAAWSAGLHLVDITTPTLAKPLAPANEPDNMRSVRVVGDVAYVAAGRDGLLALDVSGAGAPGLLSRTHVAGGATRVEVVDSVAYVVGPGGLHVVDVGDPEKPEWLSDWTLAWLSGRDLQIHDGQAFVAAGFAGLVVVDVSGLAAKPSPTEGKAETSHSTNGVHVVDGVAYLADGAGGLRLISTDDGSELAAIPLPDAWAVDVSDGFAYVADWVSGLHIVDLATIDDEHPTVHSVETPSWASDVHISNGLAWVAGGPGGVRLIAFDGKDATVVTTLDTPGHAFGLDVQGDTVYVADGGSLQRLGFGCK